MDAKHITETGEVKGNIAINDFIFDLEPNTHVMSLAVLRELANARAGTANTKTRSEVRGGGKKPYKQKGTGRARAGSIRSPLWRGGGVIFGPKPRDFSIQLPKKVRALAMRSALSQAADRLLVVDDFASFTAPKTRQLNAMLKQLGLCDKKLLILADGLKADNVNLALSARNLPKVTISLPLNLSVKTLIESDAVIVTKSALQALEGRFVA
jgi:large subunit ribosomal protein L4